MPFRAMPVLEVDGKLAGRYPKDDWQAALCDEAMDAAEDIGTRIGATMQLGPEEKKTAA